MNKVSMMKSLVVAVVLAAGVSGIAHADDGSMGRFGDSYAYFNGGGLPQHARRRADGTGERRPVGDGSPLGSGVQ